MWWEVGNEGHLYGLKLKAIYPKKGYIMNMKLILCHTELSLCSDAFFQLFCNHFQGMFAVQTFILYLSSRINAEFFLLLPIPQHHHKLEHIVWQHKPQE
jgi:hypothetical protein